MNTTINVNLKDTTLKVQVVSALYKEQQAWAVSLEDGRELVLTKQDDKWIQGSQEPLDNELVQAIGKNIDKAISSGKGPFASQETEPPRAELF